MKIAICDDEEHGRILIRKLLAETKESHEIYDFADGESLLSSAYMEYDMIFLDVLMKRMNGVQTAMAIRDHQMERAEDIWGSFPLIVFITGYREHMSDAFLLHAFGYLVKPVRRADFHRVYAQALFEVQKNSLRTGSVLLVKTGNEYRRVPIGSIRYVESIRRKNVLHLDGEEIAYYGSISRLAEELPEYFFRIHKGYLINMKYVERYDRSQLWVKGGDCLLISKYRYQDFVRAFLDFIQ